MGFSVPVTELLAMLRLRFAELLVSHQRHEIAEIIDLGEVSRLAAHHFSGGRDNSLLLWNILVLLQWLDTH
jgi:hypothetical protein